MAKRYRLVLTNEVSLQGGILITGFPGFGNVGFISTKHLVEKLSMRRIGFIMPPIIPDFTTFEDYGLSLPHEIFVDASKRIAVLLNRVNPSRAFINSFVESVAELINRINVSEVVMIGGLDVRFREGNEEYRWLKTSQSQRQLDAPMFMKGPAIVGPLAALLVYFELHAIPAIAIFPYTEPDRADHRAAAIAIKILNKILNLDVPVDELLKYAQYVEQMEESLKKLVMEGMQQEDKRSVMYM